MSVHRLDDAEPLTYDWGTIAWLVDADKADGTALTVGHVVIEPGCRNDRHAHDNCEEVLFLIAGSLRHSIGDDAVDLGPGDAIRIPAGVPHDALNTGTVPARMVISYDSPRRNFALVPRS